MFRCGEYGGRKKRSNPLVSQTGLSSFMSLNLYSLALSNTRKVFFFIRKESRSKKSATLSAVILLVVLKNLIAVVAVYHAEYIQSERLLIGDKDIFSPELPTIRHIPFHAYMAFISEVKIYKTAVCLSPVAKFPCLSLHSASRSIWRYIRLPRPSNPLWACDHGRDTFPNL